MVLKGVETNSGVGVGSHASKTGKSVCLLVCFLGEWLTLCMKFLCFLALVPGLYSL